MPLKLENVIFIIFSLCFLVLVSAGVYKMTIPDEASVHNESSVKETKRVPVLMYHHISETVIDGSNISPQRFKEHMEILKKYGYNTITDYDLYDYLQQNKPLPTNPILITFDDGYQSNYQYAYPILKELNMKATIHLITSRVIEENNLYPNETIKMSWEEVQASQDVFSFQGHTHDAHFKEKNIIGKSKGVITGRMKLNGKLETKEEYENRVLEDLKTSKTMIEEKLGTKVIAFAYPFGDYSKDTIELVKKAGHKMAYTIEQGNVTKKDNLFELKRITGHGDLTAEELIATIKKYEN